MYACLLDCITVFCVAQTTNITLSVRFSNIAKFFKRSSNVIHSPSSTDCPSVNISDLSTSVAAKEVVTEVLLCTPSADAFFR